MRSGCGAGFFPLFPALFIAGGCAPQARGREDRSGTTTPQPGPAGARPLYSGVLPVHLFNSSSYQYTDQINATSQDATSQEILANHSHEGYGNERVGVSSITARMWLVRLTCGLSTLLLEGLYKDECRTLGFEPLVPF